jgi:hypothetical protein
VHIFLPVSGKPGLARARRHVFSSGNAVTSEDLSAAHLWPIVVENFEVKKWNYWKLASA